MNLLAQTIRSWKWSKVLTNIFHFCCFCNLKDNKMLNIRAKQFIKINSFKSLTTSINPSSLCLLIKLKYKQIYKILNVIFSKAYQSSSLFLPLISLVCPLVTTKSYFFITYVLFQGSIGEMDCRMDSNNVISWIVTHSSKTMASNETSNLGTSLKSREIK